MTHNERVLQLLGDEKPHSHHELYALHVIAHSRISELRTIESWREGDLHLYRLTSTGPAFSPSSDELSAEALSAEVGPVSPSVLEPQDDLTAVLDLAGTGPSSTDSLSSWGTQDGPELAGMPGRAEAALIPGQLDIFEAVA